MNPQPNLNRFSFKEVAKKSGLSGLKLSRKDFRDQAAEALAKRGFGKIETKGILSGQRKLRPEKLKKAFQALRVAHLVKKGREAVSTFVQKEKSRQRQLAQSEKSTGERNLRERLRERIAEAEQASAIAATPLLKVQSGPLASSSISTPPAAEPAEAKDEINELMGVAEDHDLPIT